MQAVSGTRIVRKELRHSLDQETLVQQYLQEIGSSWNCATIISDNLRNLMNEQVRPHLKIMDRKNIPTTPGLHISDDISHLPPPIPIFEIMLSLFPTIPSLWKY
jgi:hypothetical protein